MLTTPDACPFSPIYKLKFSSKIRLKTHTCYWNPDMWLKPQNVTETQNKNMWLKPKKCDFFLIGVLHGHSVFSSPPQPPMTSNFQRFSIPDFIHYINLILEKEPLFPVLMFSAKQGNYSGTIFITSGTWDLPHSKPALYH